MFNSGYDIDLVPLDMVCQCFADVIYLEIHIGISIILLQQITSLLEEAFP